MEHKAADPASSQGSAWQVSATKSGDEREQVLSEIRRLGLEANALELETLGYTVLRPDQVAPASMSARVRAAVIEAHQRQTGLQADLERGDSYSENDAPLGRGTFVRDMVFADPVFEEVQTLPAVVALTSFLLGENYVLSTSDSMIKGKGGVDLALHTDWYGFPEPMPRWPISATCQWMLTDYSSENGGTAVVPGSHLTGRGPTPAEEAAKWDLAKPLVAPAGSLVIWQSGTWHCATPRSVPGVRISLHHLYVRWPLAAQAATSSRVTPEMVDRNPPRFATIMGLRRPVGFDVPDWARERFTPHSAFDVDRWTSV